MCSFFVGGVGAFVLRKGFHHNGEFLPGISVGSTDISGLTPRQAVDLFETKWSQYLESPVVFKAVDRVWTPTAEDIGLKVDYMTPLQAAHSFGRGSGVIDRVTQQIIGGRKKHDWPIQFALDRVKLGNYLQVIAAVYSRPAVEADIQLYDESIRIRDSRDGFEVDWRAMASQINEPDATAEVQTIDVAMSVVRPNVDTRQVNNLANKLQQSLEAPLTLHYEDGVWTILPKTLRGLLRIDNGNDGFTIGVDANGLVDLFESIDDSIRIDPVNGLIQYDQKANRVTKFVPWIDGRNLDKPALVDGINSAIRNNVRSVQIPINSLAADRPNDESSNLGITHLLATGESFFEKSAEYRINNIKLGAKYLDGFVINKGEVFSFNKALGPIDEESGFGEGLVIIEDRTEEGVGGGICQVSTTMFRAAFWAGLPIKERHKHIYRVPYYEQGDAPIGFDASIWQPENKWAEELDLKFLNDTNGSIMIRSLFDRRRQRLRFELWGTPTDRQAEIVEHELLNWKDVPDDEWIVDMTLEPGSTEQVEWSSKGVYSIIHRRVSVNDLELFTDKFSSSFTEWPNRYAVSPDVAEKEHPELYSKWVVESVEDAYKLLNVSQDATDEEIKLSHDALLRQYLDEEAERVEDDKDEKALAKKVDKASQALQILNTPAYRFLEVTEQVNGQQDNNKLTEDTNSS
tara:strand:- start:893 stop:2950 length:2058 start_codon:yes stop_codon:yes gene_type:complete